MSIDHHDFQDARSSLHTRVPGAHSGLTVLGTERGCGKTVLMTGLVGLMRQQHLAVRAVKPIAFGPRDRCNSENNFISSVTATPANFPHVFAASARHLNPGNWSQALSVSLHESGFTAVELPESCASPLMFERTEVGTIAHKWRDCSDFALELGFAVVLVARHNEFALEKIIMAVEHIQRKGLTVAGAITCETKMGEGRDLEATYQRNDLDRLIRSAVGVPYLGCVKFSPSISVVRVNQGNLIRLVNEGVSLAPISQATGLTL